MERTAVCALSCPYGENYRSSSDFRWIAASNSADLAGVGREGHFRFPAATHGRKEERGAVSRGRRSFSGSLRAAAPLRARLGAKPCLGRRSYSSPGSDYSSPALTSTAVSGCWRTDLAAVKGLTKQHGPCAPAACCSPAELGARRREPGRDSPQGPDLCRGS